MGILQLVVLKRPTR